MFFFPPDPPQDGDSAPQQHLSPPWWQPPEDEFPLLFPIAERLATGANAAIFVREARVYSIGVEVVIDRRMRRGELSEREWQLLQWGGQPFSGGQDPDRVRYGLALGDGQRLLADAGPGLPFGDDEPAGHTLAPSGGGGGGSDRSYRWEDGLWLWPLPPAGPIEVITQWPAQGIPESRLVVDSAPLLELARRVRPIWD